MKGKYLVSALLLALLIFPTAARADVLMPGMKLPRNEQSEAFVELYEKDLLAWDDSYIDAPERVEKLVLWRYPGSGQVTYVLDRACPTELDPCYRDSEGRYWGYINYMEGRKLSWICLSDPSNESIPADAEVVAAVNRQVPIMLIGENLPAISLVAVILLATGAMIYVFWLRGRKKA